MPFEMQKFLFVGVGGSGGVTLRMMRALLDARLIQADVTSGIPDAWQFVHIDVPTTQDRRPEGIPLLDENRYVGLASRGVRYRTLDETLRALSDGAARHLHSWRPDPDTAEIDPTQGAGKLRAVGRVIMGARMSAARKALRSALGALDTDAANQELQQVCLQLAGSPAISSQPPQVVVISSLAGGSGAGFFGDVCDLIMQLKREVRDRMTGILYTPQIFQELDDEVREGMYPNALASLSELLNGFWIGEPPGEDEFAFIKAAGGFSGAAIRRRGPRYLYVVGNRNDHMALNSQDDVFRTVARGMTAWVTSPILQDRFRAYQGANWYEAAARRLDTTGLRGARQETPLSSFGFASVGIGLDRFGRYVAERLARDAIDHLLSGSAASAATDDADDDAVDQEKVVRDGFLLATGLDEDGPSRNQIIDAIRGSSDRAVREEMGGELREELLKRVLDGWPAHLDSEAAGQRIAERAKELLPRINATHNKRHEDNATRWCEALQDVVAMKAAELVARSGAHVARRAVLDAAGLLGNEVVAQLRGSEADAARKARTMRTRVLGCMQSGGERVRRNDPRITQAVDLALDCVGSNTEAMVFGLAASVVDDLVRRMLRPLAAAIGQAIEELEYRLEGSVLEPSQAELWPGDKLVPARFEPAPNELLLEPVSGYPDLFDRLLKEQMGGGDLSARSAARQQVILGRTDDDAAQAVVDSRNTWRPRDDRLPWLHTAEEARFALAISDDDLLDRARTWARRRGTTVGEYLHQSLAAYLEASGSGVREQSNRIQRFSMELARAVKMSRPLIELDREKEQEVHRGAAGATAEMTNFPFPAGHPARAAVTSVIPDIREDKFDDDKRERIDIFTFQNAPVQPVVMASFVDPIRESWESAKGRGGAREFWVARRARPLPYFVPCAPEIRQAIVTGWFAARLLGQIRCQGNPNSKPTEVWTPGSGFRPFPFPLLGPKLSDGDEWLPAVLESLALTLIGEAADPYHRLTALGASVKEAEEGDLMMWVAEGRTADGAPTPDAQRAGRAEGTADERADAMRSELDVVDKRFAGYEVWPLHEKDHFVRAWEVHVDVRRATQAVREAITTALSETGSGFDKL